jgi:hypothetical protein
MWPPAMGARLAVHNDVCKEPGDIAMSDESKAARQDPTGHYGPGYGDPVQHLGQKPAEGEAAPAGDASPPLTPGAALPPQPVPAGEGVGADDAGEKPPLRSEDVTATPPDRVGGNAPESENAGLIFERS